MAVSCVDGFRGRGPILLCGLRRPGHLRRVVLVPGPTGSPSLHMVLATSSRDTALIEKLVLRVGRAGVMLVASDERGHAGDQKTPQVLIAHLGDPTEALLAAGGVVQRRQPEPARELTPRAELSGIRDGGRYGGRS